MGQVPRPFFDHRDPTWPENEKQYLRLYLRQQRIMINIVYGFAALGAIVIGIAYVWSRYQ